MKLMRWLKRLFGHREPEPDPHSPEVIREMTMAMNRHFGYEQWREEVLSGRVSQWADTKSPGIRRMFMSNDPEEARDVLDFYYLEHPNRVPAIVREMREERMH